jgi:hypothetical protein
VGAGVGKLGREIGFKLGAPCGAACAGVQGRHERRSQVLGGKVHRGVQGFTHYLGYRPSYDNLWVIRLEPDGRASEFTEWFMERDV